MNCKIDKYFCKNKKVSANKKNGKKPQTTNLTPAYVGNTYFRYLILYSILLLFRTIQRLFGQENSARRAEDAIPDEGPSDSCCEDQKC